MTVTAVTNIYWDFSMCRLCVTYFSLKHLPQVTQLSDYWNWGLSPDTFTAQSWLPHNKLYSQSVHAKRASFFLGHKLALEE